MTASTCSDLPLDGCEMIRLICAVRAGPDASLPMVRGARVVLREPLERVADGTDDPASSTRPRSSCRVASAMSSST